LFGEKQYWQMVRNMGFISYWPLWEAAGTDAEDLQGLGNGSYFGPVGLANKDLVGSDPAPLFADTGTAVTVYSAALEAAFDGTEGAISLWVEPADAAAWAAGSNRIFSFVPASLDAIQFATSPSGALGRVFISYMANSAQVLLTMPIKAATLLHLGLDWSAANNQVRFVVDGIIVKTAAMPGTWTQPIRAIYSNIGAYAGSGTQGWPGWIAHVGLADKPLLPSQWQRLHDGALATKGIFALGDSKTLDPADGTNGAWVQYLAHQLRTETGDRWSERPHRYATAGWAVADLKAYVNANLGNETIRPAVILVSIGSNDVPAPTAEAAFKADLAAVLDALRAKWPGITIYVSKIWRGNQAQYLINTVTINGYISDVLATYESGVVAGDDESAWLENGDLGATYSYDQVHYNAAGVDKKVEMVLDAMGL
jgi:lysophospholipase L1-like esterase